MRLLYSASHFRATSDSGERNRIGRANRLLHWHEIITLKDLGFELYDLGLALMAQNLRRRFPTESEAEIQQRLLDWRLHRIDAPAGDAEGRVVPFPRPRR